MFLLRLVNLSGQKYEKNFPRKAKIQDVVSFLMSKTKETQIFIISPNPNQNFYQNDEFIEKIAKNEEEYIVFYSLNQVTNRSDTFGFKLPIDKTKMDIIPKNAYKSFENFKEIKHIGRITRMLYFQYASVIRNVPNDFEERVNQISQCGYNRDDCAEALRNSDYDINRATEFLIRRYNDNSEDGFTFSSPFSFFGFFPLMFRRSLFNSGNESDDDEPQSRPHLVIRRPRQAPAFILRPNNRRSTITANNSETDTTLFSNGNNQDQHETTNSNNNSNDNTNPTRKGIPRRQQVNVPQGTPNISNPPQNEQQPPPPPRKPAQPKRKNKQARTPNRQQNEQQESRPEPAPAPEMPAVTPPPPAAARGKKQKKRGTAEGGPRQIPPPITVPGGNRAARPNLANKKKKY